MIKLGQSCVSVLKYLFTLTHPGTLEWLLSGPPWRMEGWVRSMAWDGRDDQGVAEQNGKKNHLEEHSESPSSRWKLVSMAPGFSLQYSWQFNCRINLGFLTCIMRIEIPSSWTTKQF